MQVKNRWGKLIVLLSFTALAIMLLTMQQLFSKQREDSSFPLPKNTLWTLHFNAAEFWQSETYEVLFEAKDDLLLDQIQQEIEKQQDQSSEGGSLGIDPHTDVIVAAYPTKSEPVFVFIVQLSDVNAFANSVKNRLNKTSYGFVRDHNGIVIIGNNNTSSKELQTIANQWKNSDQLKRSSIAKNDRGLVYFKQWANDGKSLIQETKFTVEQKEQSIHLDGTCQYKEGRISALNYDLNASGFYLSSRIIPIHLKDTLNKYLPLGSFKFTDITGIVMDYKSVYLEEAKANLPEVFGYLPIPRMNLIIQSKQKISIQEIIASCPENIRGTENTLNFGETDYQLVQLDAYTIFIGMDPTKVVRRQQNNLLSIQGEVGALLRVEGSGFMTAMIQNLGPIKKGKQFLETTEAISFTVSRAVNNTYEMNGDIRFKKGKYPLTELTRFWFSLSSM
ncbi:MAG: hypothetical protein ACOVO3_04290 [Fluviicola sp.]